MKTVELVNTMDLGENDDYELALEDAKFIIKKAIKVYEQRYHTTIGGFLQVARRSSRYGAIGGAGKVGGRYVKDLNDLFYAKDADNLRIYADDNGFNMDFYDHDGCNATTLKFITDDTLWSQYDVCDPNGYAYDKTIDYLLECKKYNKGTNPQVFKKVLKDEWGL